MMPYNERSPLVNQYDDDDDDDDVEEITCIQKLVTLICLIIVLIITLLILMPPHHDIDLNVPNDTSTVPYQYKLSHKSHWHFGYLIETYPVEFDDDDQPEFVLLAEIVSMSPSWTLGNYEVREYHKNISSNEYSLVKTVGSSLNFLMNDVRISFITKNSSYYNNTNNNNNNNNKNNNIDPLTCDYIITWNWVFNGYLHRKCELANETDYTPISSVKGSTTWGLRFLSNDGDVVYATTSETQYWWNMNRRDVDVEVSAPFPPVMPAVYTAYYDTIQRNRETNNRRHIK